MSGWSLNRKIWSIVAILSIAFIGNVFFTMNRLNSIEKVAHEITNVVVKRDQIITEIRDNQRIMLIRTQELILYEDEASLARLTKSIADLKIKQEKDFADYEKIATEAGLKVFNRYKELTSKFNAEIFKAHELAMKNKNQEAVDIFFKARDEYGDPLRSNINELYVLSKRRLQIRSDEINNYIKETENIGFAVAFSSIVVTLLLAFFVLRAVSRSISEVVSSLYSSSSQVSSASVQIAASSEQLSQSSAEQAASLQETASSIEEMTSIVAKNSETSGHASKNSLRSHQKASEGKEVVQKMITSVEGINKNNDMVISKIHESSQRFGAVVKVIEEIKNKTNIINEIVFQTKLLSFNASVEAARAGEHGKGFAVVAEEIGKLAQMSGDAATEIGTLLEDSIRNVETTIRESNQSVEKAVEEGKVVVAEGVRVARQCGDVLDEIVSNVESVTAMAGEISIASNEQSKGVSEINKAIGQLEQTTQQNASASVQCASSAEELSAQAESLQNVVGNLVYIIEGHNKKNNHVKHVPAKTIKEPKTPAQKNVRDISTARVKKVEMKKMVSGDSVKMSDEIPPYDHAGFKDI